MPPVNWTPPALRDVQQLYRFLARSNVDAAKRSAQAIRLGVKVLETQPGIGRPVEDLPEEYRDWLIDFGDSGYVVRYRIGVDAIAILAVRHQKEDGF